FCSLDGKHKSYCTPEAYRGETSWLFHNRGDGTFEDVTAHSGIFDSSSKALGVAMLDYDHDGWPDLLVANDTQPNKLYRNLQNGTFRDTGMEAGIALSSEGKARAGMGVDTGDFTNSGTAGIAITNFDNEMIGLYREMKKGVYEDVSTQSGVGLPSKNSLGFGCAFCDVNLDGYVDLLITTNNGPAYLYRNDQGAGNRSIRFHLVGTKSSRDAIGAEVRIECGGVHQSRMVKSGSSYLSQSELPVTFGLGKRDQIDRVEIQWPGGRSEEYKGLAAGKAYQCVEGKGITGLGGF